MQVVTWWIFLCIAAIASGWEEEHKVYRVWLSDEKQIQCLYVTSIKEQLNFQSVDQSKNSSLEITISQEHVPRFTICASVFNLRYELVDSNVQKRAPAGFGGFGNSMIQRNDYGEYNPATDGYSEFGWTDYYRTDTIYRWLEFLTIKYSKIVTPFIAGYTYEGRLIRGVRVAFNNVKKPGIFFESGIHAAEWIGPATATYILNQLLTSSDRTIREIAENHVWFFVPVVNPDGYEYSHTTDRLWRKTRSPSNERCYGADPNRNWDIDWGDHYGTHQQEILDPCDLHYPGRKAFSEIEVKTFSEYLTSIAGQFDTYFSFHSFGQSICFPWAFSKHRIDNYDLMMDITIKGANALSKKYGTYVKVGPIYNTIWPASGSSVDWVKMHLNVTFPFIYELRDTGRHGFILPPEQIIPTCEETLDSVITVIQEIVKVRSVPSQRFY